MWLEFIIIVASRRKHRIKLIGELWCLKPALLNPSCQSRGVFSMKIHFFFETRFLCIALVVLELTIVDKGVFLLKYPSNFTLKLSNNKKGHIYSWYNHYFCFLRQPWLSLWGILDYLNKQVNIKMWIVGSKLCQLSAFHLSESIFFKMGIGVWPTCISGTWLRNSSDLPCGCWELNPSPGSALNC